MSLETLPSAEKDTFKIVQRIKQIIEYLNGRFPVSVANGGTGQTTEAGAVGELIQALTEDTAPDWENDFAAGYDASADTGKKIRWSYVRALRGHLSGLTLSNNAGDANNDIDIAVGEATDSTGVRVIRLTSALTKRLDAAWSVGTNQGGLDGTESSGGTPDTSTWYHVYLIMRPDTGVVDVLFSENVSSPTLPTNYTHYRRIGSVYNDGSGNIRAFFQHGDVFLWNIMPFDVNVTNQGTSPVARTMSTPLGLRCPGMFLGFTRDDDEQAALAVYHGDQDNTQTFNIGDYTSPGVAENAAGFTIAVTNTSSQIYTRGNSTGQYCWIVTKGYLDRRGRDD